MAASHQAERPVSAICVPMVITMDPVDRVAREQVLSTYAVEGHYRLRMAEIERIRQSLELSLPQPAGMIL